jgi:acyl phosphate:glycerol-3-phosphate acyltransferase
MGLVVDIISVVLGYIIGSIPSAYIIGRLLGKIDVRQEPDGRISASAVHRKLGNLPFLLVVVMDVGEGVLSVIVATLLTHSQPVVLLAGFAAVVGHDWSVFMKFRGGLGATTTYGVLVAVAWWQTLIAAAVAGIIYFTAKKSGLSTAILIAALTIILLVQYLLKLGPLILVPYPVALILLMLLKSFQIKVAPLKP